MSHQCVCSTSWFTPVILCACSQAKPWIWLPYNGKFLAGKGYIKSHSWRGRKTWTWSLFDHQMHTPPSVALFKNQVKQVHIYWIFRDHLLINRKYGKLSRENKVTLESDFGMQPMQFFFFQYYLAIWRMMPYTLIWSLLIPTNCYKGGVTNHMVQPTAAFQERCLKKPNIRQATSVSGATIPEETRYSSCEKNLSAPNCCEILICFICTSPTVPCLLHFPLLASLFMSLWDTWALGFQYYACSCGWRKKMMQCWYQYSQPQYWWQHWYF